MEIQNWKIKEFVEAILKVCEFDKYSWIENLEILTFTKQNIMRVYVNSCDFFDTFRDYEAIDVNTDWGKYKEYYVILRGVKFYTCAEMELKND